MSDGNTGDGRTRLQTLMGKLCFQRFGVRASLEYGNPDVKGYRAHLKYADTIALNAGVRKVCWMDGYDSQSSRLSASRPHHQSDRYGVTLLPMTPAMS